MSGEDILNDPKWIEFIDMLADALVELKLKEYDAMGVDFSEMGVDFNEKEICKHDESL